MIHYGEVPWFQMFPWISFFLSMQKNSSWWPGFIFSKDKFKVRGLRMISGQEKMDHHQKIIMVICVWCFLIPHLPAQVSQCALFMDTNQITGFTASAVTRVTQSRRKNEQSTLGMWQRIRHLTLRRCGSVTRVPGWFCQGCDMSQVGCWVGAASGAYWVLGLTKQNHHGNVESWCIAGITFQFSCSSPRWALHNASVMKEEGQLNCFFAMEKTEGETPALWLPPCCLSPCQHVPQILCVLY